MKSEMINSFIATLRQSTCLDKNSSQDTARFILLGAFRSVNLPLRSLDICFSTIPTQFEPYAKKTVDGCC